MATGSGQTRARPQLRAAQGGACLCPLLRTPTHLLEDGASSGGSPWPLCVGRGPRLPPGGPLPPSGAVAVRTDSSVVANRAPEQTWDGQGPKGSGCRQRFSTVVGDPCKGRPQESGHGTKLEALLPTHTISVHPKGPGTQVPVRAHRVKAASFKGQASVCFSSSTLWPGAIGS